MGWPSPDVPLNQTETTLRELVGYLNEYQAVPPGPKSVAFNPLLVGGHDITWGGHQYDVMSAANPGGPAKFDSVTDDTTSIQDALDAQHTALTGSPKYSVDVVLPGGTAVYTNLRYYDQTRVRGQGKGVTQLDQKATTADVLIKPNDATVQAQYVYMADFTVTSFHNQASNTGGVLWQRTKFSKFDLEVTWTANFGVKLLGGSSTGDTMYNTLDGLIQNLQAGAYAWYLQTSAQAGNSKPDGTKITGIVNSPAGTGFLRIDKNGTTLAADGVMVVAANSQGCDTIFNSDGNQLQVLGGRFEVTSGNMTFATLTPVGSQPGAAFMAPHIACPGVVTITDSGSVASSFVSANLPSSTEKWVFSGFGVLDGTNGLQITAATAEAALAAANVRIGVVTGGKPSIVFDDATSSHRWEMQNSGGAFSLLSAGSTRWTFDSNAGRLKNGSTGTSTNLTGINAGISGTPTITGNDQCGSISLITTATPPALNSDLFTVNFGATWSTRPKAFIVCNSSGGANDATHFAGSYAIVLASATLFHVINVGSAMPASATVTLEYWVIG